MGALGPKLLLEVGGRPAPHRVIDTFLEVEAVGETAVVVPPALLLEAERAASSRPNPRRARIAISPGAETRPASVPIGTQSLTRSLSFTAHPVVAPLL